MEQELPKAKSFPCSIHPEESIIRINKDLHAQQIGFCVECIMELDKAQQGSLLTVQNVIENAVKHSSKNEFRIDSLPPSEISETLDQESEMLSKLSSHIDGQKEQVCSKFKEIQDDICQFLENSRNQALQVLDTQFNTFKENLQEFRTKTQKHFQSPTQESTTTHKDSSSILSNLIMEINNLRSTQEFESKMQRLVANSTLNMQYNSEEGQDNEVYTLNMMNYFKQELEKAIKKPPVAKGFVDENFTKSIELVNKTLQQLSKELTVFSNPIQVINYCPLRFNSEIVAHSDATKIYKIIEKMMGKSFTGYKSEKIYECEDLSNLYDIYKVWYTTADVLMLIKCKNGQTLGVYRHPKMPNTYSFNFVPNGEQIAFHLQYDQTALDKDHIIVDTVNKIELNKLVVSQYITLAGINQGSSSHKLRTAGIYQSSRGVYTNDPTEYFTVEKIEIHTIRWDNWVEMIYQITKMGSGSQNSGSLQSVQYNDGSLFGNKESSGNKGGLFGTFSVGSTQNKVNYPSQGSLSNQNSGSGGGLFGNKGPQNGGGGLFGTQGNVGKK